MATSIIIRRAPWSAMRAFLASSASGGVVLIAAALVAMLAANLAVTREGYHALLEYRTGPVLAPSLGAMRVHLWVNDGAMAVFFLLVGLEIKRELVDGRLSTWDRRRLPFIAALAGMVAPATVYLVIAGRFPALHAGWAIPAATDIAFALGVLALLGRRVPAGLKLLLASVAIVDDMGAVAIIALVYTPSLDLAALAGAAGAVALLWTLNRRGVMHLAPYLILFAVVWLLMLRSGVHATIAGVIAAMFIPVRLSPGAPDDATSPLHRLEHALQPWVAFAIVPVFAFANAGVDLTGIGVETFTEPLVLGIAAGLFVGKQAGIMAAIWGAVRLGLARKPAATWAQIWGMALVAGIGFTMSLFVGALAFPGNAMLAGEVRIGVLLGSLASALAGVAVLIVTGKRP